MEEQSLPPHVRQLLERVARENGFRNPRFELKAGSEQGDNYVGQVKRVSVLEIGDKSKAVLDLIIKCAPQNAKRRELFRTKHLFKNEVNMYNIVFPALTRMLKNKGIVSEKQRAFPGIPRVYATHLSENGDKDTLVLEDMSSHGFVMGDRFVGANVEQCRIVIRQLARLHAASFVLKEEDPEEHSLLVASLEETMCVSEWEDSYKVFAERVRPMITARFPEGTEGRAKFDAFAAHLFQNMLNLTQKNNQFSVITQGDVWINNVLFKYGKDSAIPTDACLIDFQLARYASPVCDLAYFLFCSTTKALRDQHLEQLLHDYYRFLRSFLKSFGCPNDKIVSWNNMEDQYRKYMKFGLGMGIMAIPIFMSKKGDVLGVDDNCDEASALEDTLIDKGGDNPARNERLSDVVEDMVNLGYI